MSPRNELKTLENGLGGRDRLVNMEGPAARAYDVGCTGADEALIRVELHAGGRSNE